MGIESSLKLWPFEEFELWLEQRIPLPLPQVDAAAAGAGTGGDVVDVVVGEIAAVKLDVIVAGNLKLAEQL